MHRIDPVLNQLIKASKTAKTPEGEGEGLGAPEGGGAGAGSSAVQSQAAALRRREQDLLPVYQMIARQFADMHDTPVRMLAKVRL